MVSGNQRCPVRYGAKGVELIDVKADHFVAVFRAAFANELALV
jgi:hypothetical protein